MKTLSNQRGSLLIEVLVSIGLIVMFSLAIGALVGKNHELITNAEQQTEATALAKEAMEQTVATKYTSWPTIANLSAGAYTIQRAGAAYSFVSDPSGTGESIGIFTRSVRVEPAFRDAVGVLAENGTLDPLARKITVTVRWVDGVHNRDVTFVSYLTNWQGSV